MARKKEQKLWDRLRKAAAGRIHTERIENIVGVGRPDVDTLCAGSFVPVELKQVDGWPARAATRVLGDEGLSVAQKNWHLTWRNWGGESLIVVGVGLEIFGFSGLMADCVNEYNTDQFRAAALLTGMEAIIEHLESRSR